MILKSLILWQLVSQGAAEDLYIDLSSTPPEKDSMLQTLEDKISEFCSSQNEMMKSQGLKFCHGSFCMDSLVQQKKSSQLELKFYYRNTPYESVVGFSISWQKERPQSTFFCYHPRFTQLYIATASELAIREIWAR